MIDNIVIIAALVVLVIWALWFVIEPQAICFHDEGGAIFEGKCLKCGEVLNQEGGRY